MTPWLIPLAAGLGTGLLSAWGVGGGTLLLLILTLFLGVDPSTARAINLLYFLPTAGVSLFYHRKNALLDKAIIWQAVPIGLLATVAAAWLATAIDTALLRRPFGIFLLINGVMMLRKSKK